MRQSWSTEIYDLMETLTCRVRILSLRHIQQGWADQFGSANQAVKTIQRLVKAGLLIGDVWNLPASPIDDAPLADWSPGSVCPDLERLEQIVQNRWDREVVLTPVVAASHEAARLFGSSAGGLPPQNHRNHDLLLAGVYLRYRCLQPELGKKWFGEDAVTLAERGVKNPDAFLFDQHGTVLRVIESAGRYSLAQLESFHQHCQLAQLPYELW